MKPKLILLTWLVAAQAGFAQLNDEGIRVAYYSSYRYEKAQNYPDAIKAMAPVLDAFPDGYTANLRMGWLHYLQGGFGTSRNHYERAIKLAPYSVEAKLGVLLPLLAQEKYEDVELFARTALRVDPNNYLANLRLCIALRLQQKHDAAEEIVLRLLTYYPTDVGFLTELGLLKVAKNDSDRAIRIFNDVVILDPENVVAKAQLSKLVPVTR